MNQIHDYINIALTLLLSQQAFVYFLKNKKEEYQGIINNNVMDDYKYAFLKERDMKTVYDPLSPPEQRVEARQYPFPNVIFNERTRGEPDDYQLVGLLYNTDVNKNYQLYGRRTYPGSYEWEYYIRGKDAGGLDIKFPLNIKDEIRDGLNITIPIDKNEYNVSIYDFDKPRYNPFIY